MGRKLYVGNLPYEVGETELHELFARAGTVESVNVVRDQMTGRARGRPVQSPSGAAGSAAAAAASLAGAGPSLAGNVSAPTAPAPRDCRRRNTGL